MPPLLKLLEQLPASPTCEAKSWALLQLREYELLDVSARHLTGDIQKDQNDIVLLIKESVYTLTGI